jgi:DnaJ-class molecular chaperone
LGVLFVAVLIGGGCTQKTETAPANAETPKPPDGETEIQLTAAQASTGADAQVVIPERRQAVSVKIPPGVRDGMRLRLQGMGLPGADGKPTDFFIRIRVK